MRRLTLLSLLAGLGALAACAPLPTATPLSANAAPANARILPSSSRAPDPGDDDQEEEETPQMIESDDEDPDDPGDSTQLSSSARAASSHGVAPADAPISSSRSAVQRGSAPASSHADANAATPSSSGDAPSSTRTR